MGKVCQDCGDEGVSWLLIDCQQCHDSSVHHYCLGSYAPDDNDIHWNCEDCVEKVVLSSSPKNDCVEKVVLSSSPKKDCVEKVVLSSSPKNDCVEKVVLSSSPKKDCVEKVVLSSSPKNDCVEKVVLSSSPKNDCVEKVVLSSSLKKSILKRGLDQEERRNNTCNFFNQKKMHKKDDDTKREAELSCDHIFPLKNKNNNIEMRNVGSINRAPKTIPIVASKKPASSSLQPLECDYDMNEQQPIGYFEAKKWSPISNSIVAETKSSYYQSSIVSYNKDYAQPIIDTVWRGKMVINKEKNIGLMAAHLSTRACDKVIEAAKILPPTIDFETKPRRDAWPACFQESPPTVNSIGLYFFPESKRLLDSMIKKDYSLKNMVGDSVELLLYPSHKLPPEFSRFNGKYYLWGIFRNKQKKAVT